MLVLFLTTLWDAASGVRWSDQVRKQTFSTEKSHVLMMKTSRNARLLMVQGGLPTKKVGKLLIQRGFI